MVYPTGDMFCSDTVLYLHTKPYCLAVPLPGNHRHDCIYGDMSWFPAYPHKTVIHRRFPCCTHTNEAS